MKIRKLSCEEAVRQFYAYLDRALEGDSLEALEGHLGECLDCCEKLEFSRKLDAMVKARLEDEPLPEGVEDRIRRALEAAAGKRQGSGH
jgi:anti-sigma factor (TIGR02949 family)